MTQTPSMQSFRTSVMRAEKVNSSYSWKVSSSESAGSLPSPGSTPGSAGSSVGSVSSSGSAGLFSRFGVGRTAEALGDGRLDACTEDVRLFEVVGNGTDGQVADDLVGAVLRVPVFDGQLEGDIRVAVNLVLGKGGIDAVRLERVHELGVQVFGHLSLSLSSCLLTLSWKARRKASCAGPIAPS